LRSNTFLSSIENSNWPLPTFADSLDKVWIFSKRGDAREWIPSQDQELSGTRLIGTLKNLEHNDGGIQRLRDTPYRMALGVNTWYDRDHSTIVDFIVDVKRVGNNLWAVAQRTQWSLFRLQSGEFVKEISAAGESDLTAIISTRHDNVLGFLDNNDGVVWICGDSVQVVRPAWGNSGQLINIGHEGSALWAVVAKESISGTTSQLSLGLYTAKTREVQEIFWELEAEIIPCASEIQPWKGRLSSQSSKTTLSASDTDDDGILGGDSKRLNKIQRRVTATGIYKDMIVVGKENCIMTYTIEEFLEQFDAKPPAVEIRPGDDFTALKGDNDFTMIYAGTRSGWILFVDVADFRVVERISLFSTNVCYIDAFRNGNGMKIVAISEDYTIGVIDKFTRAKVIIPGVYGPIFRLQFSDDNTLTVVYKSGELVSWSAESGKKRNPKELTNSRVLYDTATNPMNSSSSLIVEMPSTAIPQISFRVSQYISNLEGRQLTEEDERKIELIMHNLISAADDSASVYKYGCEDDAHKDTEIGVSTRPLRESFMSVPIVDPSLARYLQVDPFVGAVVIATWIALGQSLGRDNIWLEKHLLALVDCIGCESSQMFEGFSTVALLASGILCDVSLACLEAFIKLSSSEERDNLKRHWYDKRKFKRSD
jgi:hypothetical protein